MRFFGAPSYLKDHPDPSITCAFKVHTTLFFVTVVLCITPAFAAPPKLTVALAPLLVVCAAAKVVEVAKAKVITVVPREVPEPLRHVIVIAKEVCVGVTLPLRFDQNISPWSLSKVVTPFLIVAVLS